jgi:uncharacterized protein (DUF2249 family)
MSDKTRDRVIDVRQLSCMDRHSLIFNSFDSLLPGDTMEIVVDHEPKPLSLKFAQQHEGQFTWDYIEAGPVVWRVRIGRM